jgi:CDP-paratose 2-epimerase
MLQAKRLALLLSNPSKAGRFAYLPEASHGVTPHRPPICNLGGGAANSMSLLELSDWCVNRFGPHEVISDGKEGPFDIPWVVLDSSRAMEVWGWVPGRPIATILAEIACHAEENPGWLELTNA